MKILLMLVLLSSFGMASAEDPYLWLEEVEDERALAFVREKNAQTLAELQAHPLYAEMESNMRKLVYSKDRVPTVTMSGNWLYNFWQDQTHVRGIWRRAKVEEYKKKNPKWEILLDLDQLAKVENENWVWKGADCFPRSRNLCLISLSRGGKDAAVVREFRIDQRAFVKSGFSLPEAKSQVSWVDQNTIFVGTDFGKGSLSEAGYPITSRLWKRGTSLAESPEVFRGNENDFYAYSYVWFAPKESLTIHVRAPSFFESEYFWENKGKRIRLPMPKGSNLKGYFKGNFIFQLRSELTVGEQKFPQGSLVALPKESALLGESGLASLELIHETAATEVFFTKDSVLIDALENVRGRIFSAKREKQAWSVKRIPLLGDGVAEVTSADPLQGEFLASYVDFLTPASFYFLKDSDAEPVLLKRAVTRFDASGLVSEQRFSTSADGTRVPYFIVYRKGMPLDGSAPTLLYGYGGFELAMTPFYLSSIGKNWVERGGVFVLANIRGGGEFGPAWHQAALRENRQKSFDDFISVAEHLIATKVSSREHLGIQGGSNGGLLTGAVFVQRPDLFNAALVEVPLLDMLRYHKLLAGSSWIEEYGNPEVPEMREAILKYSPYQNVKKDVIYPEVFFLTSTKDDRVHPAHARKMVARMEEQGHKVYYFENIEGGHGGSANLEQAILWSALEHTYLWKKLGPQE